MSAPIKDSTTGFFDSQCGRANLPHAQRRRLTAAERRERSRAYTRASRAKQARERVPTTAVFQRALGLALIQVGDEREDAPISVLLTRAYALLAAAGYPRDRVTERLRAIEWWVGRNP